MKRNKSVTIRISDSLHDKIKMLAIRYDVDFSNAVRLLIAAGFEELLDKFKLMDKKRPE